MAKIGTEREREKEGTLIAYLCRYVRTRVEFHDKMYNSINIYRKDKEKEIGINLLETKVGSVFIETS